MEREKIITAALIVAVVFAISSFASAIYFMQDRESLKEQIRELSEKNTQITIEQPQMIANVQPSKDSNDEIDKLNAYIERLEAQLAAYKRNSESMQEGRQNGPERGNRRPFMSLEEMKTKDPQRYEEIQQRMAEMRQRMEDAVTKRNEYLDNLDMSRMSYEQQETLSEFRGLLAQSDAIMRGEGSREDMRDIGRNIFELRGQVQQILLEQLGSSSGSGNPADFADKVRQVMSITGGGNPGFRGGPGGFGGFGGQGGPGFRGGPGGFRR